VGGLAIAAGLLITRFWRLLKRPGIEGGMPAE